MVEITWLGHGSFQFVLKSGEGVVIDPWLEGNPSAPPNHTFQKIDTILITHGHFDHIADVIKLAGRFLPKVIANFEICGWLESKGVKNCSPMNKGGSQKAGSLSVTMTHALHSSGIQDDGKFVYGGEASGYILHFADNRRAYFAGDTAVFSDMKLIGEIYQPELAFLPIGDLFTMSPLEAMHACKMVQPKKVIPMHFGTFPPLTGRPEHLADLLGPSSPVEVWPLTIGKPAHW